LKNNSGEDQIITSIFLFSVSFPGWIPDRDGPVHTDLPPPSSQLFEANSTIQSTRVLNSNMFGTHELTVSAGFDLDSNQENGQWISIRIDPIVLTVVSRAWG
jgi:hypothetical protein